MKSMFHKRSTWLNAVSRGAFLTAISAVGVASVATQPARAADAISIAVVDEDKLADGFTKYQSAIKALESRSRNIGDQLDARSLLTGDEVKDFETLVVKTTLTQPEQDKVAGYVKTASDRKAEYIALNGKVTKTDDDAKRIKTLRDMATNSQEAVGQLSDKLYANLKQQQEDTDKQFTDQAKSTIIKVASDRKFTLVMRSRGVIWNVPSIDITDDVLKQLNK